MVSMIKFQSLQAGVVLSAMASGSGTHKKAWVRANRTLHEAAQEWRRWMASLPNVADTAEPSELVKDFLQRYRGILAQRWPDWAPGVEWNLSEMTALEARLEARCEPAPKTATYASVCRRSAFSCFRVCVCFFLFSALHGPSVHSVLEPGWPQSR